LTISSAYKTELGVVGHRIFKKYWHTPIKTRYAHKIQQIQHFLSSFQYRKKNSFRHWLEEREKSAAANALDVQQKNVTNVIIA